MVGSSASRLPGRGGLPLPPRPSGRNTRSSVTVKACTGLTSTKTSARKACSPALQRAHRNTSANRIRSARPSERFRDRRSARRLQFPLDSFLHTQWPGVGSASWMPAQRPTGARRCTVTRPVAKNVARAAIVACRASQVAPKLGCRVAYTEGRLAMHIVAMQTCPRDLDQLGDEIAELSAHLEAATARLLDLIREFDAREGWNTGFRSCAAWLSWRGGLDLGAPRDAVRGARALGTLPRLAQALARGELSYAKGRALTRVATPETDERLLSVGRAGTAEHVERIVRGWRRGDRNAEARESATRHRSRALHVYRDDDGMVRLRGRLEPEVGELLIQAHQRTHRTFVVDADPADGPAGTPTEDPPTVEQQQADALGL